MEKQKKPKPKATAKTLVVSIPGQQSAQDTSNWDDKTFGTPQGRDLIPALGDFSKDPNYIKMKNQPKNPIGPKEV